MICSLVERSCDSPAADLMLAQSERIPVHPDCPSPHFDVQDVNGKHLLKVEPLNAILDPQYFVRAVHQCTLNVLHGREADAFQNASENAGAGYISPQLLISPMQHPISSCSYVYNAKRRQYWLLPDVDCLEQQRIQSAMPRKDWARGVIWHIRCLVHCSTHESMPTGMWFNLFIAAGGAGGL